MLYSRFLEEFRVAPRFPMLSPGSLSSALLHLCPWASPFPLCDTSCAARNSSGSRAVLSHFLVCANKAGEDRNVENVPAFLRRGEGLVAPAQLAASINKSLACLSHSMFSNAKNPGVGIDKACKKEKSYCHKGYKLPFIPLPHSTWIFLYSVPALAGCVGVAGGVCVCYFLKGFVQNFSSQLCMSTGQD